MRASDSGSPSSSRLSRSVTAISMCSPKVRATVPPSGLACRWEHQTSKIMVAHTVLAVKVVASLR